MAYKPVQEKKQQSKSSNILLLSILLIRVPILIYLMYCISVGDIKSEILALIGSELFLMIVAFVG